MSNQTTKRRSAKNAAKVAAGPVMAIVAGIVIQMLTGIFNVPALIDQIRPGDPVAVGVRDVSDPDPEAAPNRLDSPHWRTLLQSVPTKCQFGVGSVGLPGVQLVHAGSDLHELDLTAQRSQITITSLGVRVLRHDRALTGSLFYKLDIFGCGGGPGFDGDYFETKLAEKAVTLMERDPKDGTKLIPVLPYTLQIDDGHTVPIFFSASSVSGSWTWDVKMTVTVRGHSKTIYVGSKGVVHGETDPAPFVLTALAPNAADYGVIYGRGVNPTSNGYAPVTPEILCASDNKPLKICPP